MRSSARFPVMVPAAAAGAPEEDAAGAVAPLTWSEGVDVVVAIMDSDVCAVLIFAGKCRW